MLLRWWLRQPRLWTCLVAFAGGVALTGPDDRPAWTVTVAVVLGGLATLALRMYFVDAHPDWAGTKQRRAEERLAAATAQVLARYEASRPAPEPPPPPPPPIIEPEPAVTAGPGSMIEKEPEPEPESEPPAPAPAATPVPVPAPAATPPARPRPPSHRKGHAHSKRKRRARKRRHG